MLLLKLPAFKELDCILPEIEFQRFYCIKTNPPIVWQNSCFLSCVGQVERFCHHSLRSYPTPLSVEPFLYALCWRTTQGNDAQVGEIGLRTNIERRERGNRETAHGKICHLPDCKRVEGVPPDFVVRLRRFRQILVNILLFVTVLLCLFLTTFFIFDTGFCLPV